MVQSTAYVASADRICNKLVQINPYFFVVGTLMVHCKSTSRWSLFSFALLYDLSSFAFILTRKKELFVVRYCLLNVF